MLTQRFDIGQTDRARVVEALRQRLLPPLSDRKGIVGVHLCLADESISKLETAEKNARADTTLVPTWIVLIEGDSSGDVEAVGEALAAGLHDFLGATTPAVDTSIYQLEYSRCKTPWSAG